MTDHERTAKLSLTSYVHVSHTDCDTLYTEKHMKVKTTTVCLLSPRHNKSAANPVSCLLTSEHTFTIFSTYPISIINWFHNIFQTRLL